jgi:Ca2+-binding EF-hand superfamily protein
MNQEEFAATLKYALSFIEIVPSDEILKLLFKEIDLDHDGWISYEVYFLFLRYYFGSLSEAAQKKEEVVVKLTKDE